MSEQLLHEISKKLDSLMVLVAMFVIKGMKPNEAILTLNAAGLDRNVIAELVGTTPNTVSVRLSEAKARKTPSKKGKTG